jgi:hypothetical protein
LKSDIMTMIPTFLQKHRNSKIRIQKICRGYHIKLFFDRFPTSL